MFVIEKKEIFLKIGQEVKIAPFDNSHFRKGKVVYINKLNKWFLVEFKTTAGGTTLRRGYSFFDLGKGVFIIRQDE